MLPRRSRKKTSRHNKRISIPNPKAVYINLHSPSPQLHQDRAQGVFLHHHPLMVKEVDHHHMAVEEVTLLRAEVEEANIDLPTNL